jgi:HD-GYP domain-containing protein (c-di-GMP phosphodiesterase class II)
VDLIRKAAPLHDVGKIAIPDVILRKEGKLTDEEFDVMRQHTVVGARILAGGQSELMALAETIARSHHERWDGRGYPEGTEGREIPVHARIVSIADVFDAVTTPRLYRAPWSEARAVREIEAGAGTQFDPEIAGAFLELMNGRENGSG